MLQTEIKRVKLGLPSLEELVLPSLKDEAEEVLGYAPPNTAEETKKSDRLLATLAELEIDILDWKSVRQYQLEAKHQKEKEHLASVLAQDSPPRWETEINWQETELPKYGGSVPVHALQKAIEIKRKLPEVQFFVWHLSETKDPFLVATLKTNRWGSEPEYYIEVWEEPGFERR